MRLKRVCSHGTAKRVHRYVQTVSSIPECTRGEADRGTLTVRELHRAFVIPMNLHIHKRTGKDMRKHCPPYILKGRAAAAPPLAGKGSTWNVRTCRGHQLRCHLLPRRRGNRPSRPPPARKRHRGFVRLVHIWNGTRPGDEHAPATVPRLFKEGSAKAPPLCGSCVEPSMHLCTQELTNGK